MPYPHRNRSLSRRALLVGGGLAALGACTTAAHPQEAAAPAAAASRWPPYAGTIAIDAAAGLWLLHPDDMDRSKVDALLASELAQARASGLTAVITTVAPAGRFWLTDAAFEKTRRDIAAWTAQIAANPDALLRVSAGADLERARRERRLGIIYTFQGTEPIGEDTSRIAMFHELGVRVIQLTHNRRNLVGDGCMEPSNAGLSNLGYQVVEALNAAHIVVDLAHGAPRTVRDGIAASKAPVLISHTGCRALADLPRNVSDADLRAMADRGGVAGIIFWPYLRTDTQPMAIDVIRHIEHAIRICGEDHVGIGTDASVSPIDRAPPVEAENREMIADMVEQGIFARGRPPDLYTFIPDLNMANRFEVLGAMLAARGHSDARIAKILGGNVARVLREVWG